MHAILMPIFATAAALLALAGARKLIAPGALTPALSLLLAVRGHYMAPGGDVDVQARLLRHLARMLGTIEIALGVFALARPSILGAAACAAAYALFAVALMRLRHAAPEIGCGCFGGHDHLPTAGEAARHDRSRGQEAKAPDGGHILQIALDLLACAGCVAAAAVPPAGIGALLQRPPLEAVVLAIGFGGCVCAAYLCFTALPGAFAAYGGERR